MRNTNTFFDAALGLIKTVSRLTLSEGVRHRARVTVEQLKFLTVPELKFKNREGLLNYQFSLLGCRNKEGVSGLLRVKNEAEKIGHCLRSILGVFDEIILVDNGSEDGTLEVVRKIKKLEDSRDQIKIYSYPFKIARCGEEHFNTPEDSVHNLAYYYNWCLSQCLYKYVCKWDGDMILRKESRTSFKRFLKEIQKVRRTCWCLNGQTVYRDRDLNFYRAREEINFEIMIFPYGNITRYHKIDLYEALKSQPKLPVETVPGITFYELKYASEDEFSHWSSRKFVTPRKKREWQNFLMIESGQIDAEEFDNLPRSFLDDEVIHEKA
jgi:glycosyltransferase involved in cell wall biosynthesis